MKNTKISIIIPTYNHLNDLLKPCIESIIKHTDLDNIEIIISANGCTDNTREYIESLGSPFKLIWNDEPIGYTRAINLGIKEANGEFIILMNTDVVILDWAEKNQWLDIMLEPFSNYKVGITGVVKSYDNNVNRNFMIFFLVAIRKSVFEKIGLLDEIFSPGGCEDIDFCIRAENVGYLQIEVPKDTEKVITGNSTAIADMPIYHMAEGTMHADDVEWDKISKEGNWKDIFSRNQKIIIERYGKNEN